MKEWLPRLLSQHLLYRHQVGELVYPTVCMTLQEMEVGVPTTSPSKATTDTAITITSTVRYTQSYA